MKLFFASHNLDKKQEIEYILKENFGVLYINDFNNYPDIEENGKSLSENAIIKARSGYEFTKLATFADDTGLEVEYLNNAPGVYTARYAGENANYKDNYLKLLRELNNIPYEKRIAHFITYIALFINQEKYFVFEGMCSGHIGFEPKGKNGFGYDPIFIPNGYDKTFAELPTEIKSKISHRAIALNKFIGFLNKKYNGA